MHAQFGADLRLDDMIMRREGVVFQLRETGLWRSQNIHGSVSLFARHNLLAAILSIR
jgi:hypothetical protein